MNHDSRASRALVIGGGLAGGALATRLALAGRDVVLCERDAFPADKVCGEFLSREAGIYLASLGVNLEALGAVTIDQLRLAHRQHVAETKLPFEALSISRRVLDEALLERAIHAGADVRRGAKVKALEPTATGHRAQLADDSTIEASSTFLATGKHDLRGFKRPPGAQNDLVAFKMYFRLSEDQTADLTRAIDLILFDGGYAGLSLVESSIANLCLVVERSRLAKLGQRWEPLLEAMRAESPHLDRRLRNAEPLLTKPLALSSIPYGYVRRQSDGLWRLGDQAAVIPSFSGDGMSIALHSAELAASTFLAGGSADRFQRALARDVTTQMTLATTLSRGLVTTWSQSILGTASRILPSLMATIAFYTRVSDRAIARASAPSVRNGFDLATNALR